VSTQYLALILLIPLTLLVGGCGTVTSATPVGDQVVAIESEDLDGAWLGPKGTPLELRIVDAQNGVVRITEIGDKGEVESLDVHFRRSDNAIGPYWLWSVKLSDFAKDTDYPGYLWGIAKRDSEQIVFWLAQARTFRALVESGALPGEVSDDAVHLGQLTAQQLWLIHDEDSVMSFIPGPKLALFHWDEPFVLVRPARRLSSLGAAGSEDQDPAIP
jgi:hypothetical protein